MSVTLTLQDLIDGIKTVAPVLDLKYSTPSISLRTSEASLELIAVGWEGAVRHAIPATVHAPFSVCIEAKTIIKWAGVGRPAKDKKQSCTVAVANDQLHVDKSRFPLIPHRGEFLQTVPATVLFEFDDAKRFIKEIATSEPFIGGDESRPVCQRQYWTVKHGHFTALAMDGWSLVKSTVMWPTKDSYGLLWRALEKVEINLSKESVALLLKVAGKATGPLSAFYEQGSRLAVSWGSTTFFTNADEGAFPWTIAEFSGGETLAKFSISRDELERNLKAATPFFKHTQLVCLEVHEGEVTVSVDVPEVGSIVCSIDAITGVIDEPSAITINWSQLKPVFDLLGDRIHVDIRKEVKRAIITDDEGRITGVFQITHVPVPQKDATKIAS